MFISAHDHPVCDFCSSDQISTFFAAKDFTYIEVEGVQLNSTGGWAACKECTELIKAGDWEGLLDRSVEKLREINPQLACLPGIRQEIETIHRQFRENWQRIH